MSVLEHLEELRGRLARCLLALVVGALIGFVVAGSVIDLMLEPVKASGLVKPRSNVARIEVRPDGTFEFANLPELAGDHGTQEGKGAGTRETRRLGGFDFFLPGETTPFASLNAQERSGVAYLRPMDPFIIQFKAALAIGLLLSLPVILYQLYAFVSPGLHVHERRAILPLFWMALLLFPAGAAFAWFLLKYAMLFFASYASEQAFLFNDIRAYLSFAIVTMVAFGAVFELPVVVLLLVRLGVVRVETLAAKRKIAFVVLLILSAIVTPTGDPITLMAMTVPLYLLFEFSLFLGRIQVRQNAARRAAQAAVGEE